MVQDVLADDAWSTALTNEDRRALTPLFWAHVAPYGEIKTRHAQPTDTEHTQRLTHRAFGSGDTFLTSTPSSGARWEELVDSRRATVGALTVT